MTRRHRNFLWATTATLVILALLPLISQAAGPIMLKTAMAQNSNQGADAADVVKLPKDFDSSTVDSIIANMNDEQVRRLLIQELKKQATAQDVTPRGKQDIGGLAGFIQRSRELISFLQLRIAFLRSGVDIGAADDTPGLFTFLGEGERGTNPRRAIFTVIAVFVASLLIDWFFRRLVFKTDRRIDAHPSKKWLSKIGALSFRALLDLISIGVFLIATLTIFYALLERTNAQRVLVATYLSAFLIVRYFYLMSRFLLAPKAGALRVLPMADGTALFLHRWIMAIVAVGTFGLLTCGIFRLAGTSEADHFVMVTLISLLMACMFFGMILQKRKQAAKYLQATLPKDSIRYRLAGRWHYFAILGVVIIWLFSSIQRLLVGIGEFSALKTFLIVALYFLLDWALRRILGSAFGIARKPDDFQKSIIRSVKEGLPSKSDDDVAVAAKVAEGVKGQDESAPALAGHLNISRIQRVLRSGLRITLAATMFFWIMRVWGINLPIGRAVADGTFDILFTVLVCYVGWELINAAIQRRLKLEMPDSDEDMEEGGAGGSRIGTLLLLLRKFMLIVIVVMLVMITLSRIGVDIGPLIAGAGVIGLAIGFGAQTLVKDIISGVFFLIDDAFRVGDYINVGGTKGMVEHISIRSFQLRHPRGMVNTIPFGSIGTVTNFSRDYIITKLDFRVRYDADVEKIRKIIKKKVYKKILANEELASKLLGKIKSQGVREMDDSAMVMRVKFKSIPGEQFVIRKEVYRLMQEAFKEAGIEFAHRNVTVYMPPEAAQEPTAETGQKAIGAASAGAVLQAEEEAQKAAEKKK